MPYNTGDVRIEDKFQQREPIHLNYVERKPVERGMKLVEDEGGFRLIYQRRPRWIVLGEPIWWITMGCIDLATAKASTWLLYRFSGLAGVELFWIKIVLFCALPGLAFLVTGMIILMRETRRPHQPDQFGVENGRLFRIRDGTWRTRRKDIILSEVHEVHLKELRSIIPWRREIEIAIHFRGRWQIAWRKRFGEKNMALGRRFYELLVQAIEAQPRKDPHPNPPPEYRGRE